MDKDAEVVRLSIIVPIYGVEKYLRQCLDSIVAQTFKDFECILVDDGSKDGCPVICDEYAAIDNRFKVVHKKNAGYGAAVNTGLDIAQGKWIGIVEPDDWIDPEMYEALVARGSATDADIVKAGFDSFYDDGQKSWSMCLDAGALPDSFKLRDMPRLLTNHPSIWTCVYSREFLATNGIRVEESSGATWQDNLFQVQTLVLANSIAYVSRRLYHYRLFYDKPLKDAMLPVRRSLQIRQWINEYGYKEDSVCAALLIRELRYIEMSVAAAKLSDLPKISSAASQLLSLSCFGKDIPSCLMSKRDCVLIWWLKVAPLPCVIWIKLNLIHKAGSILRTLHLRK